MALTRGGPLLREPMPLTAGSAVTFFVRIVLVTLLTVRCVLVLVLEEHPSVSCLSSFSLAWGKCPNLPFNLLGTVESRFWGELVPKVLLLVLSALSEDLGVPSVGWRTCVLSFTVGGRFSAL